MTENIDMLNYKDWLSGIQEGFREYWACETDVAEVNSCIDECNAWINRNEELVRPLWLAARAQIETGEISKDPLVSYAGINRDASTIIGWWIMERGPDVVFMP
jgi:hypothetical protein